MTARVFISYRASDGTDKATSLARDLDGLFGGAQIFLDKEDLRAGGRWRDEVTRAFESRPILLAVLTPDYLGAVDGRGTRRIDDPADPIRNELQAAVASEAHVVPLLADGVDALSPAVPLPPPFDQLRERTWRRLRAYDWRADVARLATDLEALGVERVSGPGARGPGGAPGVSEPARLFADVSDGRSGPGGAGGTSDRRLPRRALIAGGAVVAAGGVGAWFWQRDTEGPLSGRWRARVGLRGASSARDGVLVLATVRHAGESLAFVSDPVDIEGNGEWSAFRTAWRERTRQELNRVVYRGDGRVVAPASSEPGGQRQVTMAVRIEAATGGETVEHGTLTGAIEADERRIRGRLWLHGEQAERAVDLRRER